VRTAYAAPCWSDAGGGLKVCSNASGLALGGGGRWRRLEECDDGNVASGDGCSRECLVEPLYRCGGEAPDRSPSLPTR
jgi:cysteine-rich repeat protein